MVNFSIFIIYGINTHMCIYHYMVFQAIFPDRRVIFSVLHSYEVIKGLYVWCQGCSHGGHMRHLKEWFSKHPECPTGCGHLCEITA